MDGFAPSGIVAGAFKASRMRIEKAKGLLDVPVDQFRWCVHQGIGLSMEGKGHTLSELSSTRGMYLSVIHPSVKNTPFHRGDDHGCIL